MSRLPHITYLQITIATIMLGKIETILFSLTARKRNKQFRSIKHLFFDKFGRTHRSAYCPCVGRYPCNCIAGENNTMFSYKIVKKCCLVLANQRLKFNVKCSNEALVVLIDLRFLAVLHKTMKKRGFLQWSILLRRFNLDIRVTHQWTTKLMIADRGT